MKSAACFLIQGFDESQRRQNPATERVPAICGLGITFREDYDGRLHVHQLIEGGAGKKCGALQRGDILCELDGVNVQVKRQ